MVGIESEQHQHDGGLRGEHDVQRRRCTRPAHDDDEQHREERGHAGHVGQAQIGATEDQRPREHRRPGHRDDGQPQAGRGLAGPRASGAAAGVTTRSHSPPASPCLRA